MPGLLKGNAVIEATTGTLKATIAGGIVVAGAIAFGLGAVLCTRTAR